MPYRNLLTVDSSTEYLQIALQTEKSTQVRSIHNELKHSEGLMPLVQSLLADEGLAASDLDALICSRGPGSFTGLRIGMSSLKAMSLALSIPLISVSGLESIALGYRKSAGPVLATIDARRGRFYTCLYDFSRAGGRAVPSGVAELEFLLSESRLSSTLERSEEEIQALIPLAEDGQRKVASGGGRRILLVGSYKETLRQPPKGQFICLPYTPWVLNMLELGLEGLLRGARDAPEQGPEYIRAGLFHPGG